MNANPSVGRIDDIEGHTANATKMRCMSKAIPFPLYHVPRVLPGLSICVAVAAIANLLQSIEVHFSGQPYFEALVLAIITGVVIRSIWRPGERWTPGIALSANFVLESAIVLLGASLSLSTVAALGPLLLGGIACVVAAAIGTSYFVSRILGLPKRMSILIACGNAICGNSAIAAVAPVIGANQEEIASSISFTAFLGVVVVLFLPFLVPILELSLTQYGVLAGLTVYAVPQVLAATAPIGAVSNQIGTIVKLVRVLMLGPVILGFTVLTGRAKFDRDEAGQPRSRRQRLVPWFIAGFVLAFSARSLGLIPDQLLPVITRVAALLTTVAMVGLGLGVDVRIVARSGTRVSLAITVSLVALGLTSYALIRLVAVP